MHSQQPQAQQGAVTAGHYLQHPAMQDISAWLHGGYFFHSGEQSGAGHGGTGGNNRGVRGEGLLANMRIVQAAEVVWDVGRGSCNPSQMAGALQPLLP